MNIDNDTPAERKRESIFALAKSLERDDWDTQIDSGEA